MLLRNVAITRLNIAYLYLKDCAQRYGFRGQSSSFKDWIPEVNSESVSTILHCTFHRFQVPNELSSSFSICNACRRYPLSRLDEHSRGPAFKLRRPPIFALIVATSMTAAHHLKSFPAVTNALLAKLQRDASSLGPAVERMMSSLCNPA